MKRLPLTLMPISLLPFLIPLTAHTERSALPRSTANYSRVQVGKTVPFSDFESRADKYELVDELKSAAAATARDTRAAAGHGREFRYASTHPPPLAAPPPLPGQPT